MGRTTTGRNAGANRKAALSRSSSRTAKGDKRIASKDPRAASPLREVLAEMTGKRPPRFVRGYSVNDHTDEEIDALQSWAVRNVKPRWLTGIGLLEAAEEQVREAVMNGNIPPAPEETSIHAIRLKLVRARLRHDTLLQELAVAVEKEKSATRNKMHFVSWVDRKGKSFRVMVEGDLDATRLMGLRMKYEGGS